MGAEGLMMLPLLGRVHPKLGLVSPPSHHGLVLLPAVTRHHPFPVRGVGAGGHHGQGELFSQHGEFLVRIGEFLVRILLRYNRHWESQTLVGSK